MCMTNEEMGLLALYNAVTKALLAHTRPLRQVTFQGDRYSLYPVPMNGRQVPVVVLELFSAGDPENSPVHVMPLVELRTIAADARAQGDDVYTALERQLLSSATRHRWFAADGTIIAIDEATRPAPSVEPTDTDDTEGAANEDRHSHAS